MPFMALSIKNDEADHLARELTRLTGETLTMAVTESLRERVERVRRTQGPDLDHLLARLQEQLVNTPVLDGRSDEEIIGYDDHGLPA